MSSCPLLPRTPFTYVKKHADYVILHPERIQRVQDKVNHLVRKKHEMNKYIVALHEKTPIRVLEDYHDVSMYIHKYRRLLHEQREESTFQDYEGFLEPSDKVYDV